MTLGLHHTDTALGGRDVRRVIGNYLNFRTPAGEWQAADPDVEEQGTPPAHWSGAYEFTHALLRGALQVFVGDSTDPSNTALLGMRLAEEPDHWVNFKAVNVNAVPMVVQRLQRRVAWAGLWDHADLAWTLGRGLVRKVIRLNDPGHPAAFRFAMRLPAGHTYTIAGNVLRLFDGNGREWLRTPPPWMADSSDRKLRASLVEAPAMGGFPTFRIVPNATDLQTATYPVVLDPTATISGTSAIEDNFMVEFSPSNNAGGSTALVMGMQSAGTNYRQLFRIATAQIPAGTLSAFRLKATRFAHPNSTVAGTLSIYSVAAGRSWVEGTRNNDGSQAGSCCWSHYQFNTLAWTTAGAKSSGNDFDADASPPTYAYGTHSSGGDVLHTITLRASWATAWRDGSHANQGILLVAPEVINNLFVGWSSEGTTPPTFEIDYTAAGVASFMSTYRRRR
jgi:hypothetical protein